GGSLGGTWVNGERIAEYALLDDDAEISIGGYRLRVHAGARGWRGEDPAGDAGSSAERGASSGAACDRAPDAVDGNRSVASRGAQANSILDLGVAAGGSGAGARPNAAPDDLVPWRRLLHRRLLAAIDLRRQDIRQLSARQLHDEIEALLRELAHGERALPEHVDRDRLAREVLDEAIGLGPLEPLLRDDTVTEIMVNAPDEIFVERHGRLEATGASFTGEDAVRA